MQQPKRVGFALPDTKLSRPGILSDTDKRKEKKVLPASHKVLTSKLRDVVEELEKRNLTTSSISPVDRTQIEKIAETLAGQDVAFGGLLKAILQNLEEEYEKVKVALKQEQEAKLAYADLEKKYNSLYDSFSKVSEESHNRAIQNAKLTERSTQDEVSLMELKDKMKYFKNNINKSQQEKKYFLKNLQNIQRKIGRIDGSVVNQIRQHVSVDPEVIENISLKNFYGGGKGDIKKSQAEIINKKMKMRGREMSNIRLLKGFLDNTFKRKSELVIIYKAVFNKEPEKLLVKDMKKEINKRIKSKLTMKNLEYIKNIE